MIVSVDITLMVRVCVMTTKHSLGCPAVSQEALAAKQHEGIFVGWSNDGTCGQNRVRAAPEHLGHLGHLASSRNMGLFLSKWPVSIVDRVGCVRLRSARHGRT